MMTKFVACLIASAVLVTSPVAAATQVAAPKSVDVGRAASPEGAGAKAATAEEKKLCRHLPSSSSRLTNRVCLTAKEWKQVEAEVER